MFLLPSGLTSFMLRLYTFKLHRHLAALSRLLIIFKYPINVCIAYLACIYNDVASQVQLL